MKEQVYIVLDIESDAVIHYIPHVMDTFGDSFCIVRDEATGKWSHEIKTKCKKFLDSRLAINYALDYYNKVIKPK